MLLEQLVAGASAIGVGRTRFQERGNGVSQLLRGDGLVHDGLLDDAEGNAIGVLILCWWAFVEA